MDDFLGYFNNFHGTREHITWKLLFQTYLYILLINNKQSHTCTSNSLSNEWHREIQTLPLNNISHGWLISVIRLDPVLSSRLVLVSNPMGSRPFTARLAGSHLFMWLSYSSVWNILNGTAQFSSRAVSHHLLRNHMFHITAHRLCERIALGLCFDFDIVHFGTNPDISSNDEFSTENGTFTNTTHFKSS